MSQEPEKEEELLIGGLHHQLEALQELVNMTLVNPEVYSELNIAPPKGILLYGSPGTGKTLIASWLAKKASANLVRLDNSIFSKFVGESESKVQEIFQEAMSSAPSVVLIDEIDSICPSRESSEEYQRRIVTTFLTAMDSIQGRVLVIATTNRPNSLDSALRRPGRFDKEVEVPVPSASDRKDIISLMFQKMKKVSLSEEEVNWVVQQTHGFVGADLVSMCREAGMRAIQRFKQNGELSVTIGDIKGALSEVSPSSLRDIVVEVPKVHWHEIGGYNEVKLQVQQAVEWPLKFPEAFERLGVKPPKGLLLYGPPGCSKTMLAKAIATESSLNFIAIKGPELFSKYVGDTEKSIREIFRKARTCAPSVVFIDELDAMGSQREGSEVGVNERVLCTLLNEMDGIEALKNVTILGATNRPELIDKALVRPGRFDRMVYVPPPDSQARLKILEISTEKMPLAEQVDLEELAEGMEGFSGAEVSLVAREAGINALTRDIQATEVSKEDFLKARNRVSPRITPQLIRQYLEFSNKHSHSS